MTGGNVRAVCNVQLSPNVTYIFVQSVLYVTAPYDTSMVLLLYCTTMGNADVAPGAEL